MTFKEKIVAFVAKHGYTYRSYVLSILLFPPAAVYIACKKPGVPMPGRIALNVVAVTTPPFIGAATLMMLKFALDLVRHAL
ncbi:MAG TPA: hypothetical protein VJ743_12555 [Albitalea sp.]|nr:hypothetical protein [Albitalea sp.]